MANSADPDQLASTDLDLHCLLRQGISRFSRTRVKCKGIFNARRGGGGGGRGGVKLSADHFLKYFFLSFPRTIQFVFHANCLLLNPIFWDK